MHYTYFYSENSIYCAINAPLVHWRNVPNCYERMKISFYFGPHILDATNLFTLKRLNNFFTDWWRSRTTQYKSDTLPGQNVNFANSGAQTENMWYFILYIYVRTRFTIQTLVLQ
jgi:hypothetical protein